MVKNGDLMAGEGKDADSFNGLAGYSISQRALTADVETARIRGDTLRHIDFAGRLAGE